MNADSLLEYEGESLNEMMNDIDEKDAFSILENGKLEPDIEDEKEKILVDKSRLMETPREEESKLYYKKRKGVGRVLLPIEVPLHDLPFIAGKKSVEKGFDQREGELEKSSGYVLSLGAVASIFVDTLGEHTKWGVDLPEETYLPAAAAAYATGSFLRGRGYGIEEELEEEYRQQLMDEIGEYEIEFY